MSHSSTKHLGPLGGIRIIDLTRILAGPFCTMNLGDMGADIIKIEQPGKGDDTRSWGPPFTGDQAAYFLGVNRNKKSMTLNLKKPRGQKILGDLLRSSDILIENFKTGTLEKWGFTSGWFEKEAPKLVHCAITGYGDKGPKAGLPGYDFLLQAESGLMSITGDQDGGPQKLGVAIVDVCTGQYAAMCILAALRARDAFGKGQRIDISLYNTSLSMLINVASNYLIGGENPLRYGNGHPNIVPYRDYPCADGAIAIAVGNDSQFKRLADVLGHPEWSESVKFKTNPDRVKNRQECDCAIRDVLSTKSVEHWLNLFQKKNIPCSKINTVEEALGSEQANANEMVLSVENLQGELIKTLGVPYTFSKTTAAIQMAPPILGQHTKEVLRDMLGYRDGEIEKLKTESVI